MNGFSSADMSTAAANGHADGYQAGYADAVKAFDAAQPAAAQEAVTWLSKDDAQLALFQAIQAIKLGNPTDDKMILANLREAGLWIGRYAAAPVAAAPVVDARLANWIIAAVGDIPYSTMTSGQVIDALRTTRHVYEGSDGCGTYYKGDSTPAAPGIDLAPRPMATAPRDGTMLRLLVQFDDHATDDTEGPAWTIGACNDDNVHQDERVGWQFAGWCWDHDHFTEGKGTPVGWLPLIDASPKGGSDAESRFSFCVQHSTFPVRTEDGRHWIMFVATDPAYPNRRSAFPAATPEAAIDAAMHATSAEVGA